MLAFIGKILLCLSGLVIVLEIIEASWLNDKAEKTRRSYKTLVGQKKSVLVGRRLEKFADAMASHALSREREPLPAATLPKGVTAEDVANWTADVRRGRDPDELPPGLRNDCEKSARAFLLRNERINERRRHGLQIIDNDYARRQLRHLRIGATLIGIAPPVMVALACATGERNPGPLVLLFISSGCLAVLVGGALLQPQAIRSFRQGATAMRAFLAEKALKFIVAAQGKKVFLVGALVTYLMGSAIDIFTDDWLHS